MHRLRQSRSDIQCQSQLSSHTWPTIRRSQIHQHDPQNPSAEQRLGMIVSPPHPTVSRGPDGDSDVPRSDLCPLGVDRPAPGRDHLSNRAGSEIG